MLTVNFIPILLKVGLVAVFFLLVLYWLIANKKIDFTFPWKQFATRILIVFVLFAVCSARYIWQEHPQELFAVPRANVLLWLGVSFRYSVFSVYPQELVYRTFFFERYTDLFYYKSSMLLVNALLFSFCHIMFRNELVLLLTFCGGLLFGYTYQKSKSLLLTSLEHALYGVWIFTVGMGEMLAFPMP